MRLGIVSDVHGNIEALDIAIARMGAVDELLCAGDACYQFRFSNEVAARLREVGARYVLGNHEEILLSPAGIRAQQSPRVDQELLEWTRAQPSTIRVQLGGKRLLMFHATPWAPNRDYLYPSSPELRKLAAEEADYIIYGHTHYQMARRIGRALVVNPGSIGDPRDPNNDFQVSYAVLDTETDAVQIGNFSDPTRTIAKHSGSRGR
ncbi:MAG: metallophosphoesterase family protein [Chloroflexi bacterium]|nr:metallophosphoesterase family protein [Chloroflexota bacterium]